MSSSYLGGGGSCFYRGFLGACLKKIIRICRDPDPFFLSPRPASDLKFGEASKVSSSLEGGGVSRKCLPPPQLKFACWLHPSPSSVFLWGFALSTQLSQTINPGFSTGELIERIAVVPAAALSGSEVWAGTTQPTQLSCAPCAGPAVDHLSGPMRLSLGTTELRWSFQAAWPGGGARACGALS